MTVELVLHSPAGLRLCRGPWNILQHGTVWAEPGGCSAYRSVLLINIPASYEPYFRGLSSSVAGSDCRTIKIVARCDAESGPRSIGVLL